jgi:hypothetical protein
MLETALEDPTATLADRIRVIEALERMKDDGSEARDFYAELEQIPDEMMNAEMDAIFVVDVVRAIYADEPVAGIDPGDFPKTAAVIHGATARLLGEEALVESARAATGEPGEVAKEVGDGDPILIESALRQERQRFAEAQREIAHLQQLADAANRATAEAHEEHLREVTHMRRLLDAARDETDQAADARHQLATETEARTRADAERVRERAARYEAESEVASLRLRLEQKQVELEDERDQHERTRALMEGRVLR